MITVTYCDVEMDINFYYEAEQKQTLSDPGFPETIDIEEVLVNSVDIISILSDEQIDEIRDLLKEKRLES